MRSERTILLLVGLLFACAPAQSQELSTRALAQPVDWTTTQSTVGLMVPQDVQVANSSIYFRRFGVLCGPPGKCPIAKIGADGKESSFDLTKVPDVEGEVWNPAWFVNPDGSFYAVDWFRADHRTWIISFDADGKFQWKVRMSQAVSGSNVILPMDGGKLFLVSGSILGLRTADGEDRPFSAIFDRTGQLVQEVTLSTDAMDAAANVGGRVSHVNPIALAAVDSEGLVYLMRQGVQPRVQIFSPSGESLRTVDLALPGSAGWPMHMYADHGQIIVVSATSDTTPDGPLEHATPNIIFYDSITGKPTAGRVHYGAGHTVSFRDGVATLLDSKGPYFSVGHTSYK